MPPRPTVLNVRLIVTPRNLLPEITLKSTLDALPMKNLERWSQGLKLVDAVPQRASISKTFTNSLATFVKQRVDHTDDEKRLNTKERTHLAKENPHPVVPPLLSDISSNKNFYAGHTRILSVSIHRNKRLSHRTSRQTDMCPLPPLVPACQEYATPILTLRQIATIEVKTNTKSPTRS